MNYVQILKDKIDEHSLWGKEMILERNEFLNVGGRIDTNFYYVIEGALRIFSLSEQEEHTIRFGYTNNFIAALDSFISEQPSCLYIQALKKTHLKVISKYNFDRLMKGSFENVKLWNEMLNFLILEMMEREQDILISAPLERFKRVLERSPQLFQEIPHKYIASYLRMTPETLSRIKKS